MLLGVVIYLELYHVERIRISEMLARHLIFGKSIKCYETLSSISFFRQSHKLSWSFPKKRILQKLINPATFRTVRYASTISGLNKNVPIVIGILLASGGAGFAWYLKNRSKSGGYVESDETEDEPFVYEHLQEDLQLLNEFGPIPYLLVGAGCASFTAYRAIRTRDPTAKVLMIGEEPFYPYMRPPLSKEMWFDTKPDITETLSFTQWDGKNRSLFYEPEGYYFSVKDLLDNKNGGVSVIRGKKVVKIDPSNQSVYLDTGEKISYNKCLIATGSKPKNLELFEKADASLKRHITLFKTARDFQKLHKISKKVKSIVIVGGGFLGTELACGLQKSGLTSDMEVVQIFPESGNIRNVLPEYLSEWTSNKLIKEGVKVIPNVTVKSVSKEDNKLELLLSNDEVLKTDHIIVAVGSEPNTELAKPSGLEVDEKNGGFLVNTEMEARKNVWVAGDAACFYDINLGRRRVEHHDQAVVSGRLAGENMTGNTKSYWHQSMFWSDLGPDIGFEAIGIVDSTLPTIGVFAKEKEAAADKLVESNVVQPKDKDTENKEKPILKPPNPKDNYNRGVLFYLRDDIIVGILLWNVFAKMQIARQIINEAKSYDDVTEVAKLFELHSTE